MTFIPASLDKVGDMKREILVEPMVNGPEAVAAVYKLQNNERIAVLNTHDWDISIQRGTKLAKYCEVEIPKNEKLNKLKGESPKIDEIIAKLKIEHD